MRAFTDVTVIIAAMALVSASASARAADLVLPIRFDQFATPLIELEFGGMASTLMLDTGSAEGLHLTRETIEQIDGARFTGERQKSSNMAGDVQENARFMIDALTIDGLTFRQVAGVEFTPWAVTLMGSEGPPELPVIGLGLFEGRSILIDYQAAKLTVSESSSASALAGQDRWTEVPFHRTDEGLLLDTVVADRKHLMSLDSGASISMVIAARIEDVSSAVPCRSIYTNMPDEGCEFVPVTTTFGNARRSLNAYLMHENPGRFESSGVLGGDFLFTHAVLIDLKTDRMFVSPFPLDVGRR